jgi:transposase InsO family protein
MVGAGLEDAIVRLRKELPLDNGAATIRFHLERAGVVPFPAVSTIHRVLRRRGLVVDEPKKRPRSSWHRFEFPRPDDCWQIDATEWALADGTTAWIMNVLDDCSRFAVASRAVTRPDGPGAWAAFLHGARQGLPGAVLSDNGLCFSGRLRGIEVAFEANLRELGVCSINASPHHPQTCGKLERWHQTLKRWLRTQRPATTRRQLQARLDAFLAFYNYERPHRALGGATPAERYGSGKRGGPGAPLPAPPRITVVKVSRLGQFQARGRRQFGLGKAWAGRTVTVLTHGAAVHVFAGNTHIRSFSPDR